MFSKHTTFKIESVEVLDTSMVKVAAFSLPQDETYDPDFLYVKVRAVSAGEYYGDNKNGDFFPEDELKQHYTSFLTAHVFKNHENKDVANAIGGVVSANWDDNMKCVILILKIDRKIAPTVVRSIEKGYMTDVSMGCRVPYSLCSICGNKARNAKEYCDHIKYFRRKILPNGKKVYEINISPKFHDISVVLNGAEKVAKITDMQVVANTKKGLTPIQKIAEEHQETDCALEKVASVQDIINDAFELPTPDYIQKKASTEKRAAFDKAIRGIISDVSRDSVMSNSCCPVEHAKRMMQIAMTPYLDINTIRQMALQLKLMVKQEGKSMTSLLGQFFNALDFVGVDFSPREFTIFMSQLFGETTDWSGSIGRPAEVSQDIERLEQPSDFDEFPLTGALPALHKIMDEPDRTKRILIVKRLNAPAPSDEGIEDIISKIIRPIIPQRSMHVIPLARRIRLIRKPLPINEEEFSFRDGRMKDLYAMYQADRAKRLANGHMMRGAVKFASELCSIGMEKQAKGYTRTKAFALGTPIIYGYSKLQRSRINNDEDVSSANRFIAEYPEAVAGLNTLFGPTIYKSTAKGVKKALKKAGVKSGKVRDIKKTFSKAASVRDDCAYLLETGHEYEVETLLSKTASTVDDVYAGYVDDVMEQKAQYLKDVEKTAEELQNGNLDAFLRHDAFEQVCGIAKIIKDVL